MAKIEYSNEQKAIKFFNDIFGRAAAQKSLNCHPELWGCPSCDTFEEWLQRYPKSGVYPWQTYGRQFDQTEAWRREVLRLRK